MSERPKTVDWVNGAGGFLILFMLIYGSIKFLGAEFYEIEKGVHNLFPFIPSVVSTVVFMVARIIVGGDVASNMCVLLVFGGFTLLAFGFYSQDVNTKGAMFGAAGGFLGLGLGVPFGDFLRQAEIKIAKSR